MIASVLIEDLIAKFTAGKNVEMTKGTCADAGYSFKLGKDPLFTGAHISRKPLVFLE